MSFFQMAYWSWMLVWSCSRTQKQEAVTVGTKKKRDHTIILSVFTQTLCLGRTEDTHLSVITTSKHSSYPERAHTSFTQQRLVNALFNCDSYLDLRGQMKAMVSAIKNSFWLISMEILYNINTMLATNRFSHKAVCYSQTYPCPCCKLPCNYQRS